MITCYLDSQDYSTLSDPRVDSAELRRTKDDLLFLARSKQVMFAFSEIAVCEAVPVSEGSVHLAELKADLLSELCGSNALVSLDRLIGAEVQALAQRSGDSINAMDPHGRWFRSLSFEREPEKPRKQLIDRLEKDVIGDGLSRQQRRVAQRAFRKNKALGPAFTNLLDQTNPSELTERLLKRYPMKPEYAEVMCLYALGRASSDDFNAALKNSLLDPKWMMKWFSSEYSMSSPIAEFIRKPGRDLGRLMRSLVDLAVQEAQALRTSESEFDPLDKNGKVGLRWKNLINQQLVELVRKIAQSKHHDTETYKSEDIVEFCPGISAGIQSLYSSAWMNVAGGRKEDISDSQPVDALHAFYAPYVKIFRADKFMAPHIQKYATSAGTIVVPKLTQLVEIMRHHLG